MSSQRDFSSNCSAVEPIHSAANGGGLFHAIRAHFAAALTAARARFSLPDSEIAAILDDAVAN